MAVIGLLGAFEVVDDLRPSRWLTDRLDPFAIDVGSVVPRGFAAYARLFHPAYRSEPGTTSSSIEVTWAQIAEANGKVAHRMMQFPNLTGSRDNDLGQLGVFDRPPDEGSLPHSYAGRLADMLSRFTTTPESCWFGVWEGWGASRMRLGLAPTFEIPGRSMYLLRGPLVALTQSISVEPTYQSASLCWPEDRAWCLATDIDLESTYVGGSAACIRALLDRPGLEGLACDISDGISYMADTINPLPP